MHKERWRLIFGTPAVPTNGNRVLWHHPRKRHVIGQALNRRNAYHAGVVHLTMTPALGDFPPQIRKPNIGAKSLDQILFLNIDQFVRISRRIGELRSLDIRRPGVIRRA
jgi:hypothetical protein